MQELCGICFRKFNKYMNAPYVICPRQHVICFFCKYKIDQEEQEPRCPFCRAYSPPKKAFENQLFIKCDKMLKQLNENWRKIQQQCALEFFETLDSLLAFQSQLKANDQALTDYLQQQVVKAMSASRYRLAKKFLKKMIAMHPDMIQKEQFLGLGSQAELSFYGKQDRVDYWNRYYPQRSLCDDLAICCNFDDSYQQDKQWYQLMIRQYPSLYQLHFGLALLQYKKCNFKQAQNIFEQIITMEQTCYKAYQMLAFIRQLSELSYQYLLKHLRISKVSNVFTEYFLAGSQPQRICNVVEKYPDYMQPRFRLYRAYILKQDYQKAFENFLIYLEQRVFPIRNRLSHFFSYLLTFHMRVQFYKRMLPILLRMLDQLQQSLNKYDRDMIMVCVCQCLVKTQQFQLSNLWAKRFWQENTFSYKFIEILIEFYFSMQQYEEVLTLFQGSVNVKCNYLSFNWQTKKRIIIAYVQLNQDEDAYKLVQRVYKYLREELHQLIKQRKQLIQNRNSL